MFLLKLISVVLMMGWNLTAGLWGTPTEVVKDHPECNVSIIWTWNNMTNEWLWWVPDLPAGFYIPEFTENMIEYMLPWEAYWVYCK